MDTSREWSTKFWKKKICKSLHCPQILLAYSVLTTVLTATISHPHISFRKSLPMVNILFFINDTHRLFCCKQKSIEYLFLFIVTYLIFLWKVFYFHFPPLDGGSKKLSLHRPKYSTKNPHLYKTTAKLAANGDSVDVRHCRCVCW